jgi:hypothetical protein
MGEFVTCRGVYRLIVNKLVEVVGKRTEETEEEDEEEVVLRLIFRLYNHSFHRVRSLFETYLGEENSRFNAFAAQYRSDLLNYFPGVDPASELMPSFEKFVSAVKAIPAPIRFHKLMIQLEHMLTEQLEYVYLLLGHGPFREAVTDVKREISEPLAVRRELVKRYAIEETFYKTLKRADKVVKMVRG